MKIQGHMHPRTCAGRERLTIRGDVKNNSNGAYEKRASNNGPVTLILDFDYLSTGNCTVRYRNQQDAPKADISRQGAQAS